MTDTLAIDVPADEAPGAGKSDDCPYCGKHYQEGPETDAWAKHYHCWSCGYNPGASPILAGSLPGLPVPGVTAAFAQQVAAQIREQLGLPVGVNLGDLLGSLKPEAQKVAVGGGALGSAAGQGGDTVTDGPTGGSA